MLLPEFDFHEPANIDEACQILDQYGETAHIIAGGTDLMVNMKKKVVMAEHLVSLGRIDVLRQIDISGSKIRIGACVTVVELVESEMLQENASALCAGARSLGTPLIRNLATIGGNISSARPAADLPPSLMAYGAVVKLTSRKGNRKIPLGELFVSPGQTRIAADEILTEISFDALPVGAGAGYINLGVRKGQDCNIVNVASYIQLDKTRNIIEAARIVMGCVGPTHLRAPSAEERLIGEKPSEIRFAAAANAATGDCNPISDFRGSAEYRRDMVGVLTKRTLDIAWRQALGNSG